MKSLRSTGHVDGGPHGGQVVQRAAEPALLGQHADTPRSAGLVVLGQLGRVGDLRERALRRRGPLHLGDDAHTRRPQHRVGVQRRWCAGGGVSQRVQGHLLLAGCHVLPHAGEDFVENAHRVADRSGDRVWRAATSAGVMRPMVGPGPIARSAGYGPGHLTGWGIITGARRDRRRDAHLGHATARDKRVIRRDTPGRFRDPWPDPRLRRRASANRTRARRRGRPPATRRGRSVPPAAPWCPGHGCA